MTYTDRQAMFCFAALTYRGFSDGALGRFHTDLVGRAIARGIRDLAPHIGDWELVWGPAIYRAPLSVLDDELMYVARSGNRYVVAIRGTNPISAFDWTFGDIWASYQTPWLYDSTGAAKLSLSSALGLALLQHLRSPGPPGALRNNLGAAIGRTAGGLAGAFDRLAGLAIAPLRERFLGLLQELAAARAAFAADTVEGHMRAIGKTWDAPARAALGDVLQAATKLFGGHLDSAVLLLLDDQARWTAALGPGDELLTYLASEVARQAGPVEVIVTGHSAGGALASAVALWLADTQGTAGPATERWDPSKRATVSCYSYAGPSAGNAAFAARSDTTFGTLSQRIWNACDLVTHAWVEGDLERIPTLFAPAVAAVPGLERLMGIVTACTRSADYAQPGQSVRLEGRPDPRFPDFFLQFVHQHMQAYIDLLDVASDISVQTFFDPTHLLPR